jgi:hypothetical protein
MMRTIDDVAHLPHTGCYVCCTALRISAQAVCRVRGGTAERVAPRHHGRSGGRADSRYNARVGLALEPIVGAARER